MKARFLQVSALASLIILLGSAGIALWEFQESLRLFFMAVWAIACVCVAYMIISTLHTFLFQTNRFLEALLKDTLHELNIPLSVIKANLQMLQMAEKDEKKLKRLERIHSASEDLYGLYKQIDYHIKREIDVELREVFYVDEVILGVVERYKEVYNDVSIETSLLHVKMYTDKQGFAKVISNLLGNALKYNLHNRPVEIEHIGNTVTIKDEGIGMSEEELFLIFNRYYQADNAKEGYGIGLSMVKAYCDQFKIGLSLHSQKNKGTKIVLELSNLFVKHDIISS